MMIVDMHVHTNKFSSCSKLSPEEAILEAKQNGLDGICITEHDVMWDRKEIDSLREKHDFWVFPGVEVNTNFGHILVYGLKGWSKDRYLQRGFAPYFPFMELKRIADSTGAFTAASHPFREPGYIQEGYGGYQLTVSPEDVLDRTVFRMVDGIEGFNGQSSPKENTMSYLVAQALDIPALGGSDAHFGKEIGSGATIFPQRFNRETEFLHMLKNGSFRIRE